MSTPRKPGRKRTQLFTHTEVGAERLAQLTERNRRAARIVAQRDPEIRTHVPAAERTRFSLGKVEPGVTLNLQPAD